MESKAAEASTNYRSNSITLVLASGIASSILTLLGNWWLAGKDFNLMGMYVWFVLPAGAFGVGMLAGCGYVLAAWLRGQKVSTLLMASVFVLQCLAYAQAQYSEYQQADPHFADGTKMGFATYFDTTTRNIAFRGQHDKRPGKPVGGWGYMFRVFEFLGFSCGAGGALSMLRSTDYCETCERYMRRKGLVGLPAAAAKKKERRFDASGTEHQVDLQAEAEQKCNAMLDSVVRWAEKHEAEPVKQLVRQWKPLRRRTNRLSRRVYLSLTYCPDCHQGLLKTEVGTGQGHGVRVQPLWTLAVDPQFVRGMLDKNPSSTSER